MAYVGLAVQAVRTQAQQDEDSSASAKLDLPSIVRATAEAHHQSCNGGQARMLPPMTEA